MVDYIQDCDGQSLCQVIGDLYTKQGVRDADEARTYAQWVEEGLRRGITDSYYYKVSFVYEFLAKLYAQAGDAEAAAKAKEDAEKHLDGFALIDRVIAQFRNIGTPPNQELARRLIDDLELAATKPKLLEYPRYVGKLYRTKGEILELIDQKDAAIVAYQMALEASPEIGCKKQLEKLTNAPVILPEKPRPKPTEELMQIDKLTMFHFCCPACGSTPKEIQMMDYLMNWEVPGIDRLSSLLNILLVATQELKEAKTNLKKSFFIAIEEIVEILSARTKEKIPFLSPILIPAAPKTMVTQIDCPICQKPPGLRRKGNYFTIWQEAGGVQISNLYFELGAILFGLSFTNQKCLTRETKLLCDNISAKAFRAGEALGLMSCPHCGRFTTCLYGATRANPEKGICRWCLDAQGPITIKISL